MSRAGRIANRVSRDAGGMVRAATPRADELPGKDPSRKSIQTQMDALKRNLDDLYKRLGYAHKKGQREKVFVLCDLIAKQRGRFLELAARYNNLPTINEPERPAPKASMGKSKAPSRKAKTYSRWSDY